MQRIINEKEDGRIQLTARLLMNVIASKSKKSQIEGLDVKVIIWGSAVRFIACLLDAVPKAGLQTTSGNIAQDFMKDVEKQMAAIKT